MNAEGCYEIKRARENIKRKTKVRVAREHWYPCERKNTSLKEVRGTKYFREEIRLEETDVSPNW